MSEGLEYDCIIIGSGIVGISLGIAMLERNPNQQLSLGYSLGINYQLTEKSSLGLSYLSKTRFNFRKQTDLESYVGQYGTDLDDLELGL